MTKHPHKVISTTEHPENQQLLAYLKTPEAVEYNDLRLHLAGCGICRRRTELTAMLIEQGPWLESERVEADHRLDALLSGNLDPEQASELIHELKQDPARLRAALHYASHAHAMSELGTHEPGSISIWDSTTELFKQWLDFQAPIWKTVPVVIVLLTVASLLINQYVPTGQSEHGRIIAFQDNLTIQFAGHEPQPGIGFFRQQGASSKLLSGMSIELINNNRLRISWPEIAGVESYNLKLRVFRDGDTRVIARREVAITSADIELKQPLTQHRYEWVLSGDTLDNRSFQTSGGFVISKE